MKAMIIALDDGRRGDLSMSLDELKRLCLACSIEPVRIIVQHAAPNRPYYIGKGKAYEIKELITDEEMLICNEELTTLQVKNLNEITRIEVSDRTDLILRIFALRARSKEAKLQVEIARLNYELPRLAGRHTRLYSQQGGIGFRGAGETQLEIDRRRIRRRIKNANKELKKIKANRKTKRQRRLRNNEKIIALAGYTNAGKSSLMNLYTKKKTEAKDMVFTSLETATRQARIGDREDILMIDTVGFIADLPHHLIDAFKATLEEIAETDLILIVCDCSSSYVNKQIDVTLKTIKEIGIKDIPILYVYNKEDLPHDEMLVPRDPHVFISVKERTHLDLLEQKILALCNRQDERVYLCIPYDHDELYAELKRKGTILEEDFADEGIYLRAEINDVLLEKVKAYIKTRP